MNRFIYAIAICLSFAACGGEGSSSSGDVTLANQIDSISYAMGVDLSKQLKGLGIDLNAKQLLSGFNDFGKEGLGAASTKVIRAFSGELQKRQGKPFAGEDQPTTNIDSLSYALGFDYATQMDRGGIALNGQALHSGCAAHMSNTSSLDSLQIANQMQTLTNIMREKAQAIAIEEGKKNEAAGLAFLEENGKKDGVKTTASGLQYKIVKAGSGPYPKAENKVKVHYEGRLLDGSVFDSSIERGEPIEFQLTGVIPGWTEGVQLMNKGSKFQFYIPSNLAYGDRGTPTIGPKSTLIFDVELLDFQ